MLTRMELAIVALCAALLSWVLWTAVTTDRQVTAELERLRHEAAVRWTALVETGVPAERATTVVLTELRGRLAGDSVAAREMAFVPAVDLDRLWQARLLNPFADTGTSAPRTEYERRTLREERNDVRLALQAGTPAVRAARSTRAQQVLAGGISVTMLLLGGVARRVRSRRRAGLSPT